MKATDKMLTKMIPIDTAIADGLVEALPPTMTHRTAVAITLAASKIELKSITLDLCVILFNLQYVIDIDFDHLPCHFE
jgi:hypothetical protein